MYGASQPVFGLQPALRRSVEEHAAIAAAAMGGQFVEDWFNLLRLDALLAEEARSLLEAALAPGACMGIVGWAEAIVEPIEQLLPGEQFQGMSTEA
jgi:hypothetical protein